MEAAEGVWVKAAQATIGMILTFGFLDVQF